MVKDYTLEKCGVKNAFFITGVAPGKTKRYLKSDVLRVLEVCIYFTFFACLSIIYFTVFTFNFCEQKLSRFRDFCSFFSNVSVDIEIKISR